MNDTERQGKMNAADMVRVIENTPWGALRYILGAELWEKALDYKAPLPDGFTRSAFTALNSIGILEGAAGLQKWLAGKSAWGPGSNEER